METQTRLSSHNKFISAENIIGIFSDSSDDSFTCSVLSQNRECGVTVRIQKINKDKVINKIKKSENKDKNKK